jgi:hypothetical protein
MRERKGLTPQKCNNAGSRTHKSHTDIKQEERGNHVQHVQCRSAGRALRPACLFRVFKLQHVIEDVENAVRCLGTDEPWKRHVLPKQSGLTSRFEMILTSPGWTRTSCQSAPSSADDDEKTPSSSFLTLEKVTVRPSERVSNSTGGLDRSRGDCGMIWDRTFGWGGRQRIDEPAFRMRGSGGRVLTQFSK